MKIETQRLGFIGFGHLAQVMCRALQKARLIPNSQIIFHRRDSLKARDNEIEFDIEAVSLESLIKRSDLLLLCVRPHQIEEALPKASSLLNQKIVISVAAGVKISFLQKLLGQSVPVARAMPNVASSVGEGMTLLSLSSNASLEHRSFVEMLFGSFGRTMDVKEELMDIGCALAGSGPAFVLELIHAMAKEGERGGFTYRQACEIAAQTFAGAAKLALNGSTPLDLIHQIATPGGTTQAGLDAMKLENMASSCLSKPIQAAARRSAEISKEYC